METSTQSPPKPGLQTPDDQTSRSPSQSRGQRPSLFVEQLREQDVQSSRGVVVEEAKEHITLLPCEDQRAPSSENLRGGNHNSPPDGDAETKMPDLMGVTLPRSSYIVWMVFIYASLALTAWVLICLLTFKPLTTKRYTFDTRETDSSHLQAKFAKSEEIYRAARTVQAVVGVLTIPLTSAVCSAAAVVFAQSKRRERKLTLRQTMTLADKSWTDPTTIAKLLCGRGKQLSSSLLICALLLSLFGASITPLQTLLLTQETIKVPTLPLSDRLRMSRIVDIPDKFDTTDTSQTSLVTVLTRNALKATSNTTPQPRLWQENVGCSSLNNSRTERCVLETTTLGNFSALSKPYLAQVPVGYHTGLIKQFIPRINSTVKWEPVPRADMPADCGEMPNSFYVHYANATWPPESSWDLMGGQPRNWSIQACMPGNQSISPWKNAYSRQSFTEVLYLNISVMGYGNDGEPVQGLDSPANGGVFKITANTTAGYFELPNYMNGGQAGSLIDGDPDDDENCGFDCEAQLYGRKTISTRAVPASSNFQSNGSLSLATVANRGPLLTVAIALFGYDSFIPARLTHQESYIRDYDSWPKADGGTSGPWVDYASACVDQKPLSSLLLGSDDASSYDCISDAIQTPKLLDIELADYVQSFYRFGQLYGQAWQDPERSTNAFASAVVLANEAWLTSDVLRANRRVYTDPGADMVIPAISRTGMIIVSALWVVYIACLFSIAVYSAKTPRWTHQLDSFAMMRIGAAIHEHIGFDIGFETKAIDALDELPGSIGDATGGEGDVGALGMGAYTPLRGARRYKCYKGDEEKALQRAQYLLRHYGGEAARIERDGKIYWVQVSDGVPSR